MPPNLVPPGGVRGVGDRQTDPWAYIRAYEMDIRIEVLPHVLRDIVPLEVSAQKERRRQKGRLRAFEPEGDIESRRKMRTATTFAAADKELTE